MPTSSTKVVIDAGVGVWALLPVMSNLNVLNMIGEWRQNGVELYAPSLWLVETTSAIRRAVSTNLISIDEGRIALDDMIALDVTIISTTPAHCRAAFNWAARLGQSKAYDSFYLALADELGAVFYTTDQRLVNGAQQKNIAGIKWIGDV